MCQDDERYKVCVIDYWCLLHSSPVLRGLETDASALGVVIGRASHLAESISCKVRFLDQAKVCCYLLTAS